MTCCIASNFVLFAVHVIWSVFGFSADRAKRCCFICENVGLHIYAHIYQWKYAYEKHKHPGVIE